jgi:hypothetical protein
MRRKEAAKLALLFDILELLAVFLLAVEAIKLKNLKILVKHFLTPWSSRLNPWINFIDDDSHLSFWDRNMISFTLLGFYVFGILIILTLFHISSFEPFTFLRSADPIYWVVSIFGLLIIPLFVGFLPYQIVVWLLDLSIMGLTWVQLRTHTGIVGILGFLLFLLQFIGRRV